jgi:hypothetical protein
MSELSEVENLKETIRQLQDRTKKAEEDKKKAEEDKKKAEEDKKKAEEDKKKAEEAEKKAEEDKKKVLKKAEEDKKKAEEDKLVAEDEKKKIVQTICMQSPWRHLQFQHDSFDNESASSSALSSSPEKSPSKLGSEKKQNFRKECAGKCMILNAVSALLDNNLKIAHIVPKKTAKQSFQEWKMELKTNNKKNLLLLLSSIEESFDKGFFCLLMRPVPGTGMEALAVKLLNRSISEDFIKDTTLKFKDLEGKFLDLRRHVPSHRCIAKHSHYSLAAAAYKGWIEMPEYLNLIAQIKYQSPEQDKIAWVQRWLKDSGLFKFASPLEPCTPV